MSIPASPRPSDATDRPILQDTPAEPILTTDELYRQIIDRYTASRVKPALDPLYLGATVLLLATAALALLLVVP